MAFVNCVSSYLPPRVVVNEDLVQFPEKYRDVIAQKAGIRARRQVVDECTSDLGIAAVNKLLAESGIDPASVDCLICATSSPDRMQPATATRIQEQCGLRNAFAFDVNSVCSSAVFAMRAASGLLRDGLGTVVVVASEVYSKILNPNELTTYPYFGDGAGALLMTNRPTGYEIRDYYLASDGSGADVIQVPAGGTMLPAVQVTNKKDFFFTMVGRQVYDFATQRGTELVEVLRERNAVTPDLVVPHQANINIIREIAHRTGLDEKSFFVNVDKYANTAGASVLIALDEALRSDLDPQDIFLIVFGGGLSWGGCYLKKA